jgi:hypothetical protein
LPRFARSNVVERSNLVSLPMPLIVIPAQAGIQWRRWAVVAKT